MMKDKIDKEKQKGRIYRPIRTMMVGIPNVGKSSLINKVQAGPKLLQECGYYKTKTVVRLDRIQMLDMPNIMTHGDDHSKG